LGLYADFSGFATLEVVIAAANTKQRYSKT
jgi:hypothetical protein